jgi:RNA polymerase sigma factor (sigma-70 family)
MQPTDDSALMRQFAENNSDEAFAALVTRHINLVYSVAMRQVSNPHHAEEITQAVFIILAKKAASLRHDKALSSWLFQVTRLTANNFIRSEMRRLHREQEAYMQSVLNESGNDVWPKIAPLLDSAVANLREKDRQAVLLRFYEGKNLREVGNILQINEDAAEKRVSRALEKLRKFFGKRGVSSTTAIIAGTISANSVQAAPVALAKSVTAVAIAKGAAASGSTLTLIKGALKIMAWTKAKTAIVAGAVVLLAAGTTTVMVRHIQERRANAWETERFNTNTTSANVLSTTNLLAGMIDWGVVKLSPNTPKHLSLGDGGDCTLTTTLSADGKLIIAIRSKRKSTAKDNIPGMPVGTPLQLTQTMTVTSGTPILGCYVGDKLVRFTPELQAP